MKRLFIVDTENTNNYSFVSEYKLTKSDNIILFISNNMKSIKEDGCLELFNTKAKIETEKVEVGEKNSLDFQIIVYLCEKVFRGKYEDIYIISNDCGYRQAVNYLNNKFNKSVNLINYNKIAENIKVINSGISVSQMPKITEESIKKLIPEINKDNISKIIKVKNESTSLCTFHNGIIKVFGNDLGKEMYSKLKSTIKNH